MCIGANNGVDEYAARFDDGMVHEDATLDFDLISNLAVLSNDGGLYCALCSDFRSTSNVAVGANGRFGANTRVLSNEGTTNDGLRRLHEVLSSRNVLVRLNVRSEIVDSRTVLVVIDHVDAA